MVIDHFEIITLFLLIFYFCAMDVKCVNNKSNLAKCYLFDETGYFNKYQTERSYLVFIAMFYFDFALKIAIDAVMPIKINKRCKPIMFTIFFIVEIFFFCRFTSCLSFNSILNELNDYAGQREVVAEDMGHKVYGELMRYSQDLKGERKHVSAKYMHLRHLHALVKFNTSCIWNIVVSCLINSISRRDGRPNSI